MKSTPTIPTTRNTKSVSVQQINSTWGHFVQTGNYLSHGTMWRLKLIFLRNRKASLFICFFFFFLWEKLALNNILSSWGKMTEFITSHKSWNFLRVVWRHMRLHEIRLDMRSQGPWLSESALFWVLETLLVMLTKTKEDHLWDFHATARCHHWHKRMQKAV